MTRQQHIDKATAAAEKAAELADQADQYAHHTDYRPRTVPVAAVGALWADIARAHAAIAAVLPETAEEK